ncbi:MAG: hypothetical protein UY35_C0012G0009 [Candidatus Saccharibacteria bacterium GW2011_GWC2_48_9]|nr:MAG: hypothetical protein UY35_C0012G0009 [Candidatus Saccharibacteria bacterium GW2011_GWC2_48_9]HCH34333.1 hypothetical protein [Candidatus Saccharibacteria bacterium]
MTTPNKLILPQETFSGTPNANTSVSATIFEDSSIVYVTKTGDTTATHAIDSESGRILEPGEELRGHYTRRVMAMIAAREIDGATFWTAYATSELPNPSDPSPLFEGLSKASRH